jgi:hypothetical protein
MIELSNNSRLLIDNLINKCDLIKKNNIHNKKINEFLLKLFNQIGNADNYYEKNKEKIIYDINKNEYKMGIKKGDFTPTNIIEYIEENDYIKISYTFEINNKKFHLHFFIYDLSIKEIEKVTFYMKLVYLWLKMSSCYASKKCGEKLDIYIHLIDIEKKLPENKLNVLDCNNCNSAYTTSCVIEGSIIIFRKEEWFKVFIHETFHILGLDFSNMNIDTLKKKVNKIFPIEDSELNLYEAYSEFWANILNVVFTSYLLTKNSKNKQIDFITKCNLLLNLEILFSTYQTVKILDYMGLNYNDLIFNENMNKTRRKYLYREKSNIFAYYIIKGILLFNYKNFIMWCIKNNSNILSFHKTSENLNNFYKFILDNYKNSYINLIEEMEEYNEINNNNYIKNTMRMTLSEVVKN